ncbi:hypothetical protein A4G16_08730 [Mannheimia granulomatis]|uniref:DUF2572 domain-containing protein n=1 Tax=Mannheimia granulomatis TaxID=85402 RepID=A0A6G8JKD9_9PAST|nr:DUF2572 family protein [Mannheimia granulomatis]QIM67443.1 hypothetical protein A4G16_08730 [Mannheimia granulomatis]
MKKAQNGSVLLVALILIASILSILFLSKDKFIQQSAIGHFYAEKALLDNSQFIHLYQKDKSEICHDLKKVVINQKEISSKSSYFLVYQFSCRFNSLFKDKKPTKEKYIHFKRLEDYLDLSNVKKEEIYFIRKLSELPESTIDDPKIVIAQNEINETLPQNFYGIVITDYLFDITGKRMYGTLYSSYDNEREERNLTFKKEVLANLEMKYSYWDYLPNSENFLGVVDE